MYVVNKRGGVGTVRAGVNVASVAALAWTKWSGSCDFSQLRPCNTKNEPIPIALT
jgi:hypothetical protein